MGRYTVVAAVFHQDNYHNLVGIVVSSIIVDVGPQKICPLAPFAHTVEYSE